MDPTIAVRKNSLVDFPLLSKVENPETLENSVARSENADPIVVDTAIAPIVLSNSDEEAIAFVDIKELGDPSGNPMTLLILRLKSLPSRLTLKM